MVKLVIDRFCRCESMTYTTCRHDNRSPQSIPGPSAGGEVERQADGFDARRWHQPRRSDICIA